MKFTICIVFEIEETSLEEAKISAEEYKETLEEESNGTDYITPGSLSTYVTQKTCECGGEIDYYSWGRGGDYISEAICKSCHKDFNKE